MRHDPTVYLCRHCSQPIIDPAMHVRCRATFTTCQRHLLFGAITLAFGLMLGALILATQGTP